MRRHGPPTERERGTDSGQVLPLMAVVLVLIVASLVVAVRLGGLLDAAAQARTAADAAALAGAAVGEQEARAVARANGGEVVRYEQVGRMVVVVVRVGPATHEARAEGVILWDVGSRGG